MDNSEAQFLLQARRPGGLDDADPAMAGALEQTRRDPALGQWFEEQHALDTAIAAKVQAFPVPASLKADILAGKRVIRPMVFQQRRTFLALAASVVALLSLAVFWKVQSPGARPQFAAFQADMGKFLNHIDHLDFQTEDVSKARHWLETNGGHRQLVLPPKLKDQPCVGCRVLDWHGRKVSLMCYYLKTPVSKDASGKPKIEELHLLVIDRDALRDLPHESPPDYDVAGKWETASWADGQHAYILAGIAQGNYLRGYFSSDNRPPKSTQ